MLFEIDIEFTSISGWDNKSLTNSTSHVSMATYNGETWLNLKKKYHLKIILQFYQNFLFWNRIK